MAGGDINMEDGAICLFYTNNMVRNMNAAILESTTFEGAISVGFDRIIGVCSNRSAVEHLLASVANDSVHQVTNLGLMKHLRLTLEARYMVTSNLDNSDGLVN